jgi:hypothetical protein
MILELDLEGPVRLSGDRREYAVEFAALLGG